MESRRQVGVPERRKGCNPATALPVTPIKGVSAWDLGLISLNMRWTSQLMSGPFLTLHLTLTVLTLSYLTLVMLQVFREWQGEFPLTCSAATCYLVSHSPEYECWLKQLIKAHTVPRSMKCRSPCSIQPRQE